MRKKSSPAAATKTRRKKLGPAKQRRPSKPTSALPKRNQIKSEWKPIFETLEEFTEGVGTAGEPDLPLVRKLLDDLKARPDAGDRTQLEMRKFFLGKISEEEISGTSVGPVTKELAHLGALMASLVAKSRITLSATASTDEGDGHLQRACVTVGLLREYQRCFGSAQRSLDREFGLDCLDDLHEAMLGRTMGRNDRLLVAGPLAGEVSGDKFGSFTRPGIESLSAAIIEAMWVTGIAKTQMEAATKVASALSKGGYEVRGAKSAKVRPDTVKRWHNRTKKRRQLKNINGSMFMVQFFIQRRWAIAKAREGEIDSLLKILTELCRRARSNDRRRARSTR